jgi:hypothetical protein
MEATDVEIAMAPATLSCSSADNGGKITPDKLDAVIGRAAQRCAAL